MRIANSVIDLIGRTPLMALHKLQQAHGLHANLIAKVESMNPAGSAKDRIARQMILDAEEKGLLKPGSVIIEPTSGNTGIGLASIASARGYRTILTMPETMSLERRNLLKAYGAELVLTEGSKGMQGAVDQAEELARQIPDSFLAGQFTNPSNPEAHYETTGPEIWSDTEGKVDVLVATFGTGGTVSGTGKYLKEKNPDIRVIAVEPTSSPLLSKGKAGPHKIQGIGANFIPDILDRTVLDDVMTVTDDEAFAYGREMARLEGLLVGISSGAALCAAAKIAVRPEFAEKNIIVILPDTGERYLSTPMFDR